MTAGLYKILFLCTGNSARSILAEAILNRLGAGKFKAFSAGSQPAGQVNPFALALLEERGHSTAGLHSKSWDAFSGPDAEPLDFVITLCGSAEKETCPVWWGTPMKAHWGLPDPAAATGGDDARRAAFAETYRSLNDRISKFIELPFASLDAGSLQARLERNRIAGPGQMTPPVCFRSRAPINRWTAIQTSPARARG